MDASDARANLMVIEASARQVRSEVESGARPAWFFPAAGLTVGTCVGSAGLPTVIDGVLKVLALITICILAVVEIRMMRTVPHRSSFTVAGAVIVATMGAIVAGTAAALHGLLNVIHVPAADAVTGACVALVVWAMGRPTLRWLAATMRNVPG